MITFPTQSTNPNLPWNAFLVAEFPIAVWGYYYVLETVYIDMHGNAYSVGNQKMSDVPRHRPLPAEALLAYTYHGLDFLAKRWIGWLNERGHWPEAPLAAWVLDTPVGKEWQQKLDKLAEERKAYG